MDSSDLQAKYQKLATEYAKLRAQNPVLKKAVIEEQTASQELRDSVKAKDQIIRKYEQEIESFTFRNKQLTSRVEVLQRELEGTGVKVKKSKGLNLFKSTPSPNSNQSAWFESASGPSFHATDGVSVLGEELQSKIEENARLHNQVSAADEEHRALVMQLQDQLHVLTSEASKHADVLNATVSQNKAFTDKLTEEKAMLEVKLQQHEKEIRELMHRAETAEESLRSVQTNLTQRLAEATKIIRDKVPFNDTRCHSYNALNVPTHDRQHQLKAKDLVVQAGTLIKQLVQALSNFHTYTEQRCAIYPVDQDQEPLSDVNRKFCQYLHENAAYLRPVDQAFRCFSEDLTDDALTTLETACGLQGFASKLKAYVSYMNKLLPYHLLSIEEECSVSTCTQTLESKNLDVHAALQRFTAMLIKVQGYVALVAQQSDPHCDHPRSSHGKLFELLTQSVLDFHEAVKDLSKHFNTKVCLEHQLPTIPTKLKTTDECIVSSLVALVTCTSKLSAFLSSNLQFFTQSAGYRTRGSSLTATDVVEGPRAHPAVVRFRQKAANYISKVATPCPDSVPYQVAIHNRKTLLSSTESRESLAQQVVTFQERVGKLEQDREHWMLESQLLQMKYEKEQQRSVHLSKQLCTYTGGNAILPSTPSMEKISRMESREARANTLSNQPLDTVMLGSVDNAPCSPDGSDSSAREELIKKHFTDRISELVLKLQTTDSRALNFQAECRALHKRLTMGLKVKENLSTEVTGATQSISSLKDDLATTTRSYEGQLSMMSEHLAAMNEKLAVQKDEIESLKYTLQNTKGGKKGRLK